MGLLADLLDCLPTYRESDLGKKQVARRTVGQRKSLGRHPDERCNGLWRKRTDAFRRPHGNSHWPLGCRSTSAGDGQDQHGAHRLLPRDRGAVTRDDRCEENHRLRGLLQRRTREQILSYSAMEWAERSVLQHRAVLAEHLPCEWRRA